MVVREDQVTRFYLNRREDVSGVSGCGRVAAGVILPSGKVVLEWVVGQHRSVEFWTSIQDCIAVHGHGNKTQIDWEDKPQ